jgi:putative transcriptional regulator
MIQSGSYIKSTAKLVNTFFENAKILITENNLDGAVGFVENKAFGKSLHELSEFSHSKPFPLLDGGPVDREHLFVLHRRPDLIEGGKEIGNGFYLGGNMEHIIEAINIHEVKEDDIQLYIGYCGWDAGELEIEVEEGSWTLHSA